MADGYFLKEADKKLLEQFLQRERNQRLGTITVDQDRINAAPEVYVAYCPYGISERSDLIPGYGIADIYRVVGGVLTKVEGYSKTVYNYCTNFVFPDTFVEISRDKYGIWWVRDCGGTESIEPTTGTGTYGCGGHITDCVDGRPPDFLKLDLENICLGSGALGGPGGANLPCECCPESMTLYLGCAGQSANGSTYLWIGSFLPNPPDCLRTRYQIFASYKAGVITGIIQENISWATVYAKFTANVVSGTSSISDCCSWAAPIEVVQYPLAPPDSGSCDFTRMTGTITSVCGAAEESSYGACADCDNTGTGTSPETGTGSGDEIDGGSSSWEWVEGTGTGGGEWILTDDGCTGAFEPCPPAEAGTVDGETTTVDCTAPEDCNDLATCAGDFCDWGVNISNGQWSTSPDHGSFGKICGDTATCDCDAPTNTPTGVDDQASTPCYRKASGHPSGCMGYACAWIGEMDGSWTRVDNQALICVDPCFCSAPTRVASFGEIQTTPCYGHA